LTYLQKRQFLQDVYHMLKTYWNELLCHLVYWLASEKETPESSSLKKKGVQSNYY
jgi:hypothetical protein